MAALGAGTVALRSTSSAESRTNLVDYTNSFTVRIDNAAKQIISLSKESGVGQTAPLLNYFYNFFAIPNSSNGGNQYEVATNTFNFKLSQLRWVAVNQSGPHESNFILEISKEKDGKWTMTCTDNPDSAENKRHTVYEINEKVVMLDGKVVKKSQSVSDSLLNSAINNVNKLLHNAEQFVPSLNPQPALNNVCNMQIH